MRTIAIISFMILVACGGDDDGGSGGDAGGEADAGDDPDGGGDDGPRERVEGDVSVYEGSHGEDGTQYSYVQASILDPRPRYHRLEMEAGTCRLWVYDPTSCDDCEGLCNAEGECVPFPTPLSAGVLTIGGVAGGDIEMQPTEYGYFLDGATPADLFAAGDPVTLEAEGDDAVGAFSIAADGVDPLSIDLEEGGEGQDALYLEDGADLTLSWDPAAPGTRVRLELNTDNRGHGYPVDAMIECESEDTGSLTVPRAMIEAFPEKPLQFICAGSDCPPSSLTRYTWDRATIGDIQVELRVEFRRQFLVVHEPG